jgi:hypothetical protein
MGNTIPLDEVIVGLEENLIKNSLWLVERASNSKTSQLFS